MKSRTIGPATSALVFAAGLAAVILGADRHRIGLDVVGFVLLLVGLVLWHLLVDGRDKEDA